MQLKEKKKNLETDFLFNEIVIIDALFLSSIFGICTHFLWWICGTRNVFVHVCLHEQVIVRKDENRLVRVQKISGFSL